MAGTPDTRNPGESAPDQRSLRDQYNKYLRGQRAPNVAELGTLDTGIDPETGRYIAVFEGRGYVGFSGGVGYLRDGRGGMLDLRDLTPPEAQVQFVPNSARQVAPHMAARVRITVETELIPLSELREIRE